MIKGTLLLIGSNAHQIDLVGGKKHPTGFYLNELAVPAMKVIGAGYEIVLATPSGANPVMDKSSKHSSHFGNDEERLLAAVKFVEEHPAMQAPQSFRAVINGGLDKYVGVFVPGGQAPVVDLMQNAELGQILRHFHDRKMPTAFLCHGPVATLAAIRNTEEYRAALVTGDISKARKLAADWPYAGYQMTVISQAEESVVEKDVLHAKMYFYMPDALETAGATVTVAPPWESYVVEDRELITGQNPASDEALATALVAALDRSQSASNAH